MVKKTVGSVTVEWVQDPGKRVAGQWKISCPFWEVYPTDNELKEVIAAAQVATAERDVASSWHQDGVCLRCGDIYLTMSTVSYSAVIHYSRDRCPSCGYSGDVVAEGQ